MLSMRRWNDQYEYLVRRPVFNSDQELEDIFNIEGAGGWILVSFLHNPNDSSYPYLAVFYRKKLD